MKSISTAEFTQAHRIIVVGTSCAGKSSFAKKLATVSGLRHVELDALYWSNNWQARHADEFRSLTKSCLENAKWISDGNYRSVRDLIWPQAELVCWLNYSFPRVFMQALRRSLLRIARREPLYSDNRETLLRTFFSRHSILLWVIKTHHRRRRDYQALRTCDEFPQLRWQEFRTPAEAQKFLQNWGTDN
jgi:adenylate kinase family enzyme